MLLALAGSSLGILDSEEVATMYIAGMTINDVPPFRGEVGFKFDKRVNVFIGPNASGKSTLLEQVLVSYRREWANAGAADTSKPELSYINGQPIHLTRSESCVFALEDHDADDHRNLRYDMIIVPAARVRYGAAPEKVGPMTDSETHDFFGVETLSEVFYQDWIHSNVSALYRTIEGKAIDDQAARQIASPYTDYELLHPFVEAAAKEDPRKAGVGLNEALAVAHSCAKDICREIVMGSAPINDLAVREVESDSGLPKPEPQLELAVRVQTNDLGVSSLDMTSLSAGTEGTLWWTRLIALSLLFMNEFEPGWAKRGAILLIDEIENHLHPTWQRRVIPALLEHFPGLQIFATTHSPFVVAGLKAGQVHLLNRENGVVTATTNTEDIEGWTADEILRVFMGVDEPTDEPTAQATQQLSRLRDEGARADERAENERQSEISRLRHIVDRAALSGPRAAEDARFLADLRSILHRYSQQQDLNQENG